LPFGIGIGFGEMAFEKIDVQEKQSWENVFREIGSRKNEHLREKQGKMDFGRFDSGFWAVTQRLRFA